MHSSESQVEFQGSAGERQPSAPNCSVLSVFLNQGFSTDNFVPPPHDIWHTLETFFYHDGSAVVAGIRGQEAAGTLQRMAVPITNRK